MLLKPIAEALKEWFLNTKRDLPWRKNISPYAVWVSEVMLQQTQVQTVIPYFNRWMDAFPTVEKLAEAPLEQVIKLWEGLGYYSRARNLHKGAKQVLEKYQGKLPQDAKELLQITGIGPYTQGAILSFAFRKRSILIDGNVKRVISRLLGLKLDFSIQKNHQTLEKKLYSLLPEKEPWVFNEALMELGALICTPSNPQCLNCPLQNKCTAFEKKLQDQLPLKPKRKKTIKVYRILLLLDFEKTLLVKKETKKLMKDLHEFPFIEIEKPFSSKDQHLIEKYQENAISTQVLLSVKHSYTHHQVTLYPIYLKLSKPISLKGYQQVSIQDLQQIPFSAGHRKVMHSFVGS